MYITASLLYDYLQCPHRVWRDVYGPQQEKNPESNPFVQLLWEKGVNHEKKVVSGMGTLTNLSSPDKEDQLKRTIQAMNDRIPIIYHGYIRWESLAGEPDILRLQEDGTYIPLDIKSGRGLEGISDDDDLPGKPKKHYAVQLALYAEILIGLGFAKDRKGVIYDIDNKETIYDLEATMGVKNTQSWWQEYQRIKSEVSLLIENKQKNTPALSGICKLCPWYQSCRGWCESKKDLSTLFYLGRAKRETLIEDLGIDTIDELCDIDIPSLLEKKSKDKTFLPGFAEKTLTTNKKRALIMARTHQPIIYQPIIFPQVEFELFFDIEDDPTQGFVYLHGVYERSSKGERFLPFVARDFSLESEKHAWKEFIDYIFSLPENSYCLYYYSHHEVTTYKRMQTKYPDLVSTQQLEMLFDTTHCVDLYTDVILKNTDWPLFSYSLKEIAHYLKFNWRDKTPSGALSIQWFNEYLEDKDPAKLKRIIEYNEDDCKATMIIKDELIRLQNNKN